MIFLCQAPLYPAKETGISLKSKEWSRIYEIPVGAIEEEGHEYSATYEVVLRTDAHFHQPIWGLYELPPVKVYPTD